MTPGTVLVVNAGSSSLKLRLLDAEDELLAASDLPPPADPADALAAFLAEGEPDAIGHRIVHGGVEYAGAVRVDRAAERNLERLAELAPLHNPPALAAVEAALRLRPEIPNVACFDTAFHATLPPEAATYAIPGDWLERWRLRRFGFHGLSHAYAARRAADLLDRPLGELRLVTAHLGAGASLAAVDGGRSADTTMGFTPLDGLVMATRPGILDPGLVLWVQRHGGLGVEDVENALNHDAGLLGLSGRSSDMRDVLAGVREGDPRCRLAFDVYSHRLAAAAAAMAASLGGVDALVFTGGVGENIPEVRAEACRRLAFLGVEIDPRANAQGDAERLLSGGGSTVAVLVVTAREDLEIAAGVREILGDIEADPSGP
jgi:acetate kinase